MTTLMMALSQVMLWDEQLNQEMAKLMLAEGVLVIPLRFFMNEDGCNQFSAKKGHFFDRGRKTAHRTAESEIRIYPKLLHADMMIYIYDIHLTQQSWKHRLSHNNTALKRYYCWLRSIPHQLPSGGPRQGSHQGSDQRGSLRPGRIGANTKIDLEVPQSTLKYLKLARINSKYLEVPQSNLKYPEVPQST